MSVGSGDFTEVQNKKQKVAGPKLRGKSPTIPSEQKSYQHPRPPGRPRKVFRDQGKRVKTATQGDI